MKIADNSSETANAVRRVDYKGDFVLETILAGSVVAARRNKCL